MVGVLMLEKCKIIFPVNTGKQTYCSATYSVFGSSSVLATFVGGVPRHVTSRGKGRAHVNHHAGAALWERPTV